MPSVAAASAARRPRSADRPRRPRARPTSGSRSPSRSGTTADRMPSSSSSTPCMGSDRWSSPAWRRSCSRPRRGDDEVAGRIVAEAADALAATLGRGHRPGPRRAARSRRQRPGAPAVSRPPAISALGARDRRPRPSSPSPTGSPGRSSSPCDHGGIDVDEAVFARVRRSLATVRDLAIGVLAVDTSRSRHSDSSKHSNLRGWSGPSGSRTRRAAARSGNTVLHS